MGRENFGKILDETVNQLNSKVTTLKNQQANITTNITKLEKQRSALSQEIIDLTAERDKIKKKTQAEVDKMLEDAREKVKQANKKEIEASSKMSNANNKTKKAEDLIKSNEGLRQNLLKKQIINDERTKKLLSVVEMINEVLKK